MVREKTVWLEMPSRAHCSQQCRTNAIHQLGAVYNMPTNTTLKTKMKLTFSCWWDLLQQDVTHLIY